MSRMGNSGPHTSKESGVGAASDLGLKWGHSGMQGWRASMEDAHFAIPTLNGWGQTAAFGVLDGHGGADVSKYCARQLPEIIAAQSSRDPSTSLATAFYKLDDILAGQSSIDANSQGATACVTLVSKDRIIVANAGDSRAVLCRGGRAVALSEDHKPSLRREQNRIAAAGGMVTSPGPSDRGGPRVMGDLNLSRSLGDHRHKQDSSRNAAEQIITCTPDVTIYNRQPNDEFLLLACDGVWDVLSNEDAVSFIQQRLPLTPNTGVSLTQILEDMLDACLSPDLIRTQGLGGDNMTAVLVTFDNQGVNWGMRHITSFLGCHVQPCA